MPRVKITPEEGERMAVEYEAGATIDELTRRYPYGYGGIYRALKRAAVTMRSRGPKGGNDD